MYNIRKRSTKFFESYLGAYEGYMIYYKYGRIDCLSLKRDYYYTLNFYKKENTRDKYIPSYRILDYKKLCEDLINFKPDTLEDEIIKTLIPKLIFHTNVFP